MKLIDNLKKSFKKTMAYFLAFVMMFGLVPANLEPAHAASATVALNSLGSKGTVTYGGRSKSGTWWKMKLGSKEAFCIDLGYTCHVGNSYETIETHHWNQGTGGEKYGYNAKILRWYVLSGKRSKKSFVMSQALIWSVAEGRNSKSELKDVIKQVKANTGYYSSKSDEELYKAIFEPSGNWTVDATYWKKSGNSKSYQRLITVDADKTSSYEPSEVEESAYYRQRITVKKVDEDGNGLGGIKFTLDADDIDHLYSFQVSDRNGVNSQDADSDNDTEFSLTGYTRDTGRLAFRMTYRLQSESYVYFKDSELSKMNADEKKAAKKHLTDDMDLTEGVDFGKNMTKKEAEALAKADLKKLKDNINNTYKLTENDTGDNKNIVVDPEYANGKTITLTNANSWEKDANGNWPESGTDVPSDYALAYQVGVTNKYKKASVKVVKVDKNSTDKKAHGDANLEGAEFGLYADQGCTTVATVYDANGTAKAAGTYTVSNGGFSTDYLRSGTTYYLKETKAPVGYKLTNEVLPISVDASSATAEYTSDISTVEYGNQPVFGKVELQKYYVDDDPETREPEANTTFQIYLKSKGSYDAADEYEKDTLKTDEKGHAVSKDLYCGTYIVHQVDSGDVDAIHIDDFEVEVTEDGKVYQYSLDNKLFKAFLKIIKKDGKTEKTVLKPGTTYQIYKVTDAGEELVTQTYKDGDKDVTVDKFICDETGEIQTVKALRSATYRIYEIASASGLHISEQYIEVTINSKADNYESYVDEEGNEHALITVSYTNDETCGLLSISKSGQMLTGWDNEKHEFIYEQRHLKGVKFEVYADGDIVTQDNQGDTWFKDGDKVATITTGVGTEFTSTANGICTDTLDDAGVTHITLPLLRIFKMLL